MSYKLVTLAKTWRRIVCCRSSEAQFSYFFCQLVLNCWCGHLLDGWAHFIHHISTGLMLLHFTIAGWSLSSNGSHNLDPFEHFVVCWLSTISFFLSLCAPVCLWEPCQCSLGEYFLLSLFLLICSRLKADQFWIFSFFLFFSLPTFYLCLPPPSIHRPWAIENELNECQCNRAISIAPLTTAFLLIFYHHLSTVLIIVVVSG